MSDQKELLLGQPGDSSKKTVPQDVVDGQIFDQNGDDIPMANPVNYSGQIQPNKSCIICGEEAPIDEFFKLECGHSAKKTCLKEMIIQELND